MCSACQPSDVHRAVDETGREWLFEFHHFCGPMVVGKRGEPLNRQPGTRSPFWKAFETWRAAHRPGQKSS